MGHGCKQASHADDGEEQRVRYMDEVHGEQAKDGAGEERGGEDTAYRSGANAKCGGAETEQENREQRHDSRRRVHDVEQRGISVTPYLGGFEREQADEDSAPQKRKRPRRCEPKTSDEPGVG